MWGDGPDFCIVQHGKVTLAFDRSRDGVSIPVNQHWAAYIYVENVDELYELALNNDVQVVRGPEDTPYGSRDFDIRDPDGHILAFGHDLERNDQEPESE